MEQEVSANGEQVVKKITFEHPKRSIFGFELTPFVDLLVKSIGVVAIFVPILLFYLQQKSETNNRKSEARAELYSKTTIRLHTLLEKPVSDTESLHLQNTLFYELYPLLRLRGDEEVAIKFDHIKNNIACYLDCIKFTAAVDRFRKYADSARLLFIYKYIAQNSSRSKLDSALYEELLQKNFIIYNDLIIQLRNFRADYIEGIPLDTIGRSTVHYYAEQERKIIDSVQGLAATIYDNLDSNAKSIHNNVASEHINRLPIEGELDFIHQLMDVEHFRFLYSYNRYLRQQTDILDNLMYSSNE